MTQEKREQAAQVMDRLHYVLEMVGLASTDEEKIAVLDLAIKHMITSAPVRVKEKADG